MEGWRMYVCIEGENRQSEIDSLSCKEGHPRKSQIMSVDKHILNKHVWRAAMLREKGVCVCV